MKRKIIQIIDIPVSDHTDGYMVALCDDGTVWFYQNSEWTPMKKPIPQDEIPEA